jgi:hypothetical protein
MPEGTVTRSSIARAIAAATVLSTAPLAAQSTAPPNVAPPQGEQRQPAATTEEMKITGCLSAAANAGAATGEANNASKYQLKTTPVGKTDAGEYALLQPGTPDLKLESYVGRKVEITARPAATADPLSKPQSNEGVSTSQPSGSTGMETIPPPSGRTLVVSAVKVIASSCQ